MSIRLLEEADALSQAIENWRQIVLRESPLKPDEMAFLARLASVGHATVPAIARAQGLSRQAVQVRMDSLAKRRWVASTPNPAHRRSPLFSLTDRGRGVLESVRADELAAVDRLRPGTSDQAVRDAIRVIAAWKEALNDESLAHERDPGSS
ncbi:MAG: MarR family transcriptional regulator [Myxococcota bacterium]